MTLSSLPYLPNTNHVDGIELGFIGIGFVCVPLTILAYMRINAKREAYLKDLVEKGQPMPSATELRALGDRAPDFKYVL